MVRYFPNAAMFMMISAFCFGCATKQQMASFTPHDLNHKVKTGYYSPKVDNFVILLDTSFSMREPKTGFWGQSKFDFAKEIARNMNRTIPDIKLNAGLRIFGQDTGFSKGGNTNLVYGLKRYSEPELENVIAEITKTGWTSPMFTAVNASDKELTALKGKTAFILLSDGKCDNKKPVKAAKALKEKLGDALCIYPIMMGDHPDGVYIMEEIAKTCGCGFFVKAEEVAAPDSMADFVTRVFLKKGKEIKPKDSDGDGVPDSYDKCPNTPKRIIVDEVGCPLFEPKDAEVTEKGTWIFNDILFDSNKWDIKPEMFSTLDKLAGILKNNPTLVMVIEGHTNTIGTQAHNIALSQNRAESVKNYLISKGVERERLTAVGYGFDRPMTSNDTDQGRARNRRVEFVPIR
jgi:OOP family OmpA-OmpF porin